MMRNASPGNRANLFFRMTDLSLTIRAEHPSDHAAIERLHERAFGPGRFARTAFRLRESGGHDLFFCLSPPMSERSLSAPCGSVRSGRATSRPSCSAL